MDELKCPSCQAPLQLIEAMPEQQGMPSMEEANTLPLDTLRKRLPKKSEE